MKLGLFSGELVTNLRSTMLDVCPYAATITRELGVCRSISVNQIISVCLGDDARSRRVGLSKARRV